VLYYAPDHAFCDAEEAQVHKFKCVGGVFERRILQRRTRGILDCTQQQTRKWNINGGGYTCYCHFDDWLD